MAKILSIIMLLLLSFIASAQTYRYQLKGSFKLKSSSQKGVEYTLQWNEEDGKIKGEYSDNYFIDSAPVAGNQGDLGRNFIVKLPSQKKGVQSITLLVADVKMDKTGTSIPVSVVTRDRRGNPLTTTSTESNFITISTIAQKQESQDCHVNLGALGDFCGPYAGMITEDQDRRNKCNLLYADAVKLELNPDSSLVLRLGTGGNLVEEPIHQIGRLPVNPKSNAIDVMSRSCRALQGVNASSDTCKQLSLRGEFSKRGSDRHFRGTYSIKEEGTNTYCVYTLSMDLET
jgi:hypothetical protein